MRHKSCPDPVGADRTKRTLSVRFANRILKEKNAKAACKTLLLNIQKKASVSTYEAWSFGEKLHIQKKKKTQIMQNTELCECCTFF
jgi:hypothetical protein